MEFLRSLFGRTPPARVLMLGWPGKTKFLFYQAHPQLTTIPTIGFNVEDIKCPGGLILNAWDIGGCDKIRPLVRHYFDGLRGVLFFVATDTRENLDFSLELLEEFVFKYELPAVPLGVFCVHRDLDSSAILPADEVNAALQPLLARITDRPVAVVFGSTLTTHGHAELLGWMEKSITRGGAISPSGGTASDHTASGAGSGASGVSAPEASVPGAPSAASAPGSVPSSDSDALSDDAFLAAVADYSLPAWDHKTHLRLAYLVLVREGRRAAVSRVMELISQFIEHSPRTARGKKFHVTMTYFWIHLVHYALATYEPAEGAGPSSADPPSFEALLARQRFLLDGGLFRQYYSDELMLRDPASRQVFVLPDKAPLPNVLPRGRGA